MIVPEMLGGGERDCKLLLLAAAVLVGIISSLQVAVRAEVYNVGDGVFLYSRGSHDVLRVNQRDFLTCSASTPIETDASGETAFQLRAGGYYFICGFPEHCRSQQRVYVKVLPAVATLPHQTAGGNLPAYTQSAEGPTSAATGATVLPLLFTDSNLGTSWKRSETYRAIRMGRPHPFYLPLLVEEIRRHAEEALTAGVSYYQLFRSGVVNHGLALIDLNCSHTHSLHAWYGDISWTP
ncbi:hypothetical protein AXG93_1356s1240 [Marchantia polymorpha subsp. ruderalis]|uniref:Phytocyanin domain-containing protein n=1 Tax=Marchantia polymorpha subsp. ruderalis TaxID=1480154 RepID=A0A176WR79_MARPO|nr:hypothetical protein AXG93_1356s1240 [Marchantia polymorpha subsp. ruderalis]